MTRRRKALCRGCADAPPRRVLNATLCTPCYTRRGRPVKECIACSETFAADVMQGRRCRPCVSQAAHAKRIGRVFGITPEQYEALLLAQDGACAICRRRPQTKRLAVDHRHSDGVVRGLLCRSCNRDVVGGLRESIEAFERAIAYIREPPAIRVIGVVVVPDVTPQQEDE